MLFEVIKTRYLQIVLWLFHEVCSFSRCMVMAFALGDKMFVQYMFIVYVSIIFRHKILSREEMSIPCRKIPGWPCGSTFQQSSPTLSRWPWFSFCWSSITDLWGLLLSCCTIMCLNVVAVEQVVVHDPIHCFLCGHHMYILRTQYYSTFSLLSKQSTTLFFKHGSFCLAVGKVTSSMTDC